jgi:hypothetical protein
MAHLRKHKRNVVLRTYCFDGSHIPCWIWSRVTSAPDERAILSMESQIKGIPAFTVDEPSKIVHYSASILAVSF